MELIEGDVQPSHEKNKGLTCFPLGNNFCVFCRFPIWPDEKVAAIVGDWASSRWNTCTLGFQYPHVDEAKFDHSPIVLYQRNRTSTLASPCRRPACNKVHPAEEEMVIYHIDCFHVISNEEKLSTQAVWNMGLWTRTLPRPQYHDSSCDDINFLDNLPVDADSTAYHLSVLPRELRVFIAGYSNHERYWMPLQALYRRRLFRRMVPDNAPVKAFPLPTMAAWTRGGQPSRGTPPSDSTRFRLRLDGFGASQFELIDGLHQEDGDSLKAKWFALEKIDDFLDATVLIKGKSMRIISSRQIHVWQDPSPPSGSFSWNEKWRVPSLARSVPLAGLTGITAFCHNGRCYWIQPHYANDKDRDATPPVQEYVRPSERKTFTPIYYPLADGEFIDSVCVRFMDHHNGPQCSHTLILRTNIERVLRLGDYIHPSNAGVTLAQVATTTPSHLILPYHDLSVPDANFAAICTDPDPSDDFSFRIPWDWATQFPMPSQDGSHYFTTAPMFGVCQTRVFYRPRPQPRWPRDRQCTGVILYYESGAMEALGSCYGWEDSELMGRPRSVFVRRVDASDPENRSIEVQFSTVPAEVEEAKDGVVDGWRRLVLDGDPDIVWWATDEGPVDIMKFDRDSSSWYVS